MHEELALAQPYSADAGDEGEDFARLPSVTEVSASSPTFAPHEGQLGRSVGRVTAAAYERHATEIHGFLLRIVRDPDVAADLTADAFTKLLTEELANRTPLQPRPWLYRVASNLAMSRGRRLKAALRTSRELESRERREHSPSAERELLDRERDDDLHRALAGVSREERSALLLAAAGYEGAAIASLIGKSHVATRTLMCRARRRLRTALAEQDPR